MAAVRADALQTGATAGRLHLIALTRGAAVMATNHVKTSWKMRLKKTKKKMKRMQLTKVEKAID